MSGRPQRRSLAESFKPDKSRGSDLVGVLPPRPSTESSPPGAPPESPERTFAVILDEPESLVTRDASESAAAQRHELTAADVVRNVAVYLPVDLMERFRRTSRSREMTYADLLVEAAAAHSELMPAVFADRGADVVRGAMPARARRGPRDPGVQVQIRLDGHQLAWLEGQAARVGAPSRTALVAALLHAHLGSAN